MRRLEAIAAVSIVFLIAGAAAKGAEPCYPPPAAQPPHCKHHHHKRSHMGPEVHNIITVTSQNLVIPVNAPTSAALNIPFSGGPRAQIPNVAPYDTRRRFYESIAVPLIIEATLNEAVTGIPLDAVLTAEIFVNKLVVFSGPVDLTPITVTKTGGSSQNWVGNFAIQFQNPIPIDIAQTIEIGFSGLIGPVESAGAPFLTQVTVFFDQRYVAGLPAPIFKIVSAQGSLLYSESDKNG